jgi:hypothetical protein
MAQDDEKVILAALVDDLVFSPLGVDCWYVRVALNWFAYLQSEKKCCE